jgi:phage FluMu protein Com
VAGGGQPREVGAGRRDEPAMSLPMFLPVACLKCGKLFQVPEAAAGSDVTCPFCKSLTTALPVAAAPQQEPFSLDEAPQLPPVPRPDAEPSVPARRSLFATAAIAVVLVVVILGVTVALLRYGSGSIPPSAWSEFTAPDGSSSIQLPGEPVEKHLETTPVDGATRGLHLFTTTGWYSRARVWFGWRDLDPAWVKQAAQDRDGAIINPVLSAERDRRREQTEGTIQKQATVRFGPHLGLEVWMDTPRGKLIERYIVTTDGPRPRLYFMGIESKSATADGPAAQKLFHSFRIRND